MPERFTGAEHPPVAEVVYEAPQTRRRRVLLVEDNAVDRDRILPVLDTLDIAVDVVGSVEGGLRQDRLHKYVGAIVDLNLSSSSQCEGFILIAALRERGARYPIVIMSHNGGLKYELKGFEVGANDYMVKWPQREEMRDRLRHLMVGNEGGGQATRTPE